MNFSEEQKYKLTKAFIELLDDPTLFSENGTGEVSNNVRLKICNEYHENKNMYFHMSLKSYELDEWYADESE